MPDIRLKQKKIIIIVKIAQGWYFLIIFDPISIVER